MSPADVSCRSLGDDRVASVRHRPAARTAQRARHTERRARAQRDRESQMRACLLRRPRRFRLWPERVVRVVRRRIDLEQRLERRPRPLGLAGVEVRPPSASRIDPLPRLQPVGALEDDRRLRVMPSVRAARGRAGAGRTRSRARPRRRRPRRCRRAPSPGWWHGRAKSVADRRPTWAAAQPSRYAARSTGWSRGESVRPGIRPRLAIGCAVDLLDVAGEVDRRGAADVRADRVRVDRRAGLLEVARCARG